MKKTFFGFLIFLAFGLFLIPNLSLAEENKENKVCAVYFTFIGCPNCAYIDPIVLTEWPQKYSNLVVIEYTWEGGDFEDPNSQFFGEYSHKCGSQAAVPCLALTGNNIKIGRNNIPAAEKDIKNLEPNLCLLKDKSVAFENLDLNELPANPKVWANKRVLIKKEGNNWLFQWKGDSLLSDIRGDKIIDNKLAKELLFTKDISKIIEGREFEIVEPEKAEFSGSAFPKSSDFISYAEFENAIKINVLGEEENVGSSQSMQLSQGRSDGETVEIPIIGRIKTEEFSLPILTFFLGLADGFNPCAFFVLTFLLAALLGLAGSRKKIILVGSIFVFFSGLLYFLFMAVLLNVFRLGEELRVLTIIAGGVAIFAGIVNIKDYFFFQKGISFTLPKSTKSKFIQRVKKLKTTNSIWALGLGSAIIAGTVNLYELLCTFGFPMVYTRALTLRSLSSFQYYLYLVFYNLIYIVPLTVIVLIFATTLGKKTFSKGWVRRLKLMSGFMILFLGMILMFKPNLLENVLTAFGTLISAIIISGLIIFISSLCRKRKI